MKMSKDIVFVLKLAMLSSLIGTIILMFVWLGGITEQSSAMTFRSVVTTILSIFTLFMSIWGIVGLIVGFAHVIGERPQRKSRKLKNS
jgi:hypothetical protein